VGWGEAENGSGDRSLEHFCVRNQKRKGVTSKGEKQGDRGCSSVLGKYLGEAEENGENNLKGAGGEKKKRLDRAAQQDGELYDCFIQLGVGEVLGGCGKKRGQAERGDVT